tara:strand:- start:70 stop:633 length:564 start_codon:yes stop_codon:yes gene_type:complete
MKEEKYKLDSFVGGWYINEKICDELVNFFEKSKHRQRPGMCHLGVHPESKISTDIPITGTDSALDNYNKELQKCLLKYIKRYPELNKGDRFSSSISDYQIQKYKPNEGFFVEHYERGSLSVTTRMLVFMTYLNTVEDGGTVFKYQKLTTKAVKGLTLIWPSDFTHTHRGQISKTKEKYIITGWYNFY